MKKLTFAVAIAALVALGGASQAFAVSFIKQKVCSVYIPNNWRDTVIAGKNWTAGTCQAYAAFILASHHQLVCITKDGFDFGIAGTSVTLGTAPSPDCGWTPKP